MKICLACEARFDGAGWRCPACGNVPRQNGYVRLTADRGDLVEGYDAEEYERVAAAEEHSFWARRRNELLVWAIRTYFREASSFLEVGCGAGIVLGAVRKALPQMRMSGGDAYRPALEIAQWVEGVELLHVDTLRLPFEEEFDLVGLFDVLEHVADDEAALRELHRCVHPGGGLVLTVPQHPWLWSAADEWALHHRRYTREGLVRKVTGAGFEVRRVTSFVSLLLPALAVVRALPLGRALYDPCREFRIAKRFEPVLDAIMAVESGLIRRGLSFPAGGSLLVVALRPSRHTYASGGRARVHTGSGSVGD